MQLINGFEIARDIKLSIEKSTRDYSRQPCLAVIIAGNNPASEIYIKNKEKACLECGFRSLKYSLSANVGEEEILELIQMLNADAAVDGILLQLPLPKHIDENRVIASIDPSKDADCFHPLNVGKLFSSRDNFNHSLLPCTANGCLRLIKSVRPHLDGGNAVVIGRSNVVGKPTAQLLLNENCTVTIVHSKSRNIGEITKNADIVVVAVGRPRFLKKSMVKEDTILIDVGINRLEDGSICGDIDFHDMETMNVSITPVPKGVGPMTVACLMENTYNLFARRENNFLLHREQI
ncbi:MAG: bifunctional 5,10-methylenetetrahydrofolate dehydrogenase/5,10-methenyltetrahydrofolate cyclohydrolase [Rickettsiales bacterium]|jgi:methylenetetrahydrofolate dehydrogenase (NADP+)/methenyltetrahydrofolate cyclohydrolase|nr:bifunctional 5,10-methylenetetrahydrofolate dehydrogenase/5,10-methenyltetrahydrofolate cyclohydrolase [Rickettsiales bacterium]